MKVTALAGGVGGAKLADGFARVLLPGSLTIIVNTGDDFEHYGLSICPDLDTVCYTLAGLACNETGWGRVDESWRSFNEAVRLGGPQWFGLGDQDLGTHLERTRRLHCGDSLTRITQDFCKAWGISAQVLPMSDQPVATHVHTRTHGILPFQEYFVKLHCEPIVEGFSFHGIASAKPADGVLNAISTADVVIFCPSNPWVSIAPILAVPGIGECIRSHPCVIAVSPIIGGKAVKGPAAKMYQELGIVPCAQAVAEQYRMYIRGFVLDEVDHAAVPLLTQWGIIPCVRNTLMLNQADRQRLADEIISFSHILLEGCA